MINFTLPEDSVKNVNTENDADADKKFDDEINSLGRFTSIIALALMFGIPLIVTMRFEIPVNVGETLGVMSGLIAMFAPMAIIENISYYAIIGAGGVYLSCITGNIMNMKLPSAISGMKLADAEPGSRKGDIISIISIGMSSIVTVTILFFGMLVIGEFLTPILSHAVLKPGFDNIMPSLLGALVMPFVLKSPKLAFSPFALSIALCLTLGVGTVQMNQSYLLPVVMIASVLAARVLYKSGMLPQKPQARQDNNKKGE